MKKTKLSIQWNKVTPLSKYLAMALFVALPFVGFILGTKYQRNISPDNVVSTKFPIATTDPSPIAKESPLPSIKPKPTLKPAQNGASLENIRYSLPKEGEAEIKNGMLILSPTKGGGSFYIKVYNYSGTDGRREYYCQLVDYCTSETNFEKVNIGNIEGYIATILDNSGSGPDLFGAKGNKFYIISSYALSSANVFSAISQQVLNSLVF